MDLEGYGSLVKWKWFDGNMIKNAMEENRLFLAPYEVSQSSKDMFEFCF